MDNSVEGNSVEGNSVEGNFIVFCDGASNPHSKRSGIGAVWFNITQFDDPSDGRTLKTKEEPVYFLSQEIFSKTPNDKKQPTNNEAEYHSLISALKLSIVKKMNNISVYMDSKLVINQVQNKWKINFPHLQALKDQVDELKTKINFRVYHILREYNSFADLESKKCIGEDHKTKLTRKRLERNVKKNSEKNAKVNESVNQSILDLFLATH